MPLSDQPPIIDFSPEGFRLQSATLVNAFRMALSQVVRSTIGDVLKSHDVRDRLGVDAQISWQVRKLLSTEDPLRMCLYVPNRTQLLRLCKALKRRGADQKSLDAAQATYAAFQSHVQAFGETREKFNAILAYLLRGDSYESAEIIHRRAVFDAHRFIFGVERKVHVYTRIYRPSASSFGQVDAATLVMIKGMTRFNPDVPLVVETSNSPPKQLPVDGLPLNAEVHERSGSFMLPQFCRPSVIPTTTDLHDGWKTVSVSADWIGYGGSIDLAFGRVHRPVALSKVEGGWFDRWAQIFRVPVMRYVNVIVIDKRLSKNLRFETSRWGHSAGRTPMPEMMNLSDLREPKLPCADVHRFMGTGRSAVELVDVPDHGPCVQYACESQSWDLNTMDVYQLAVDYPLMDSRLVSDMWITHPQDNVSQD